MHVCYRHVPNLAEILLAVDGHAATARRESPHPASPVLWDRPATRKNRRAGALVLSGLDDGDTRGVHVTAIDLSPRLIELARARDPGATINYQVGDLSQPRPGAAGRFDAVGSYLALNDVAEYRGFAATLATSLKLGGRLALAFNNPYSAVTDRHVTDYFDSGAVSSYRGLWESGIQTYHHHRTLENYLDAFHAGGLRLTKLTDVLTRADSHRPDAYLPPGGRFPYYMLLAFSKP